MTIQVERLNRIVTVLPEPPFDPTITRMLKERYTEADGWTHAAFAVMYPCKSVADAKALAERIQHENHSHPE